MWSPQLGMPAKYTVGESTLRVMVTAHCTYVDRVESFRIEWLDTTNRPVSEWVERSQLSPAD